MSTDNLPFTAEPEQSDTQKPKVKKFKPKNLDIEDECGLKKPFSSLSKIDNMS